MFTHNGVALDDIFSMEQMITLINSKGMSDGNFYILFSETFGFDVPEPDDREGISSYREGMVLMAEAMRDKMAAYIQTINDNYDHMKKELSVSFFNPSDCFRFSISDVLDTVENTLAKFNEHYAFFALTEELTKDWLNPYEIDTEYASALFPGLSNEKRGELYDTLRDIIKSHDKYANLMVQLTEGTRTHNEINEKFCKYETQEEKKYLAFSETMFLCAEEEFIEIFAEELKHREGNNIASIQELCTNADSGLRIMELTEFLGVEKEYENDER